MLARIVNLVSRKSNKNIVEKYTEDLSQITAEIHNLDKVLQRREKNLASLQSKINYYGLAIGIFILSYVHWYSFGNILYVSLAALIYVGFLVFIKWITYRIWHLLTTQKTKKLSKLKAIHAKKLNQLKTETRFNETNSIIKRFTSGNDENDDQMLLLDEELVNKQNQLTLLKEELSKLQNSNKVEKDAWFDKVLNVIAGGNEQNNVIKPIICEKCQKHTGAYKLANKSLTYICPQCNWKYESK
ncbi:hypothetical protein KAFR_0B06850 [Kazachstania africana CBS 2517]|uniref:Lunapark zinc ribbon domain-containing protein n=1 Tax=Kazachstania africana (strain ATCC 22294 / BCRC 22015 / CBS 2517 / CECT 1963 / NBRC 1671 / NRRL Y-8276) TaxID=1071382 RepID=H2ARI2_KAZAF|nr:hypothetical protein KAFR_0B06850 [Kazachstania africana CBS 2517]CCF56982.1 hypothetical protein KAFR_0B06850 [Kazachstania africana CBS 2517]